MKTHVCSENVSTGDATATCQADGSFTPTSAAAWRCQNHWWKWFVCLPIEGCSSYVLIVLEMRYDEMFMIVHVNWILI